MSFPSGPTEYDDGTLPHLKALVESFPMLTYHYGMSFSELVNMPRWAVRLYINELPALLAGEQMKRIEAASFPHSKPGSRRSTIRRLERARPKATQVEKPKDDAEFIGALATFGFGFQVASSSTSTSEKVSADA